MRCRRDARCSVPPSAAAGPTSGGRFFSTLLNDPRVCHLLSLGATVAAGDEDYCWGVLFVCVTCRICIIGLNVRTRVCVIYEIIQWDKLLKYNLKIFLSLW